MTRDEAIERIKAGLKARSGKRWSVRPGSGTASGWIHIRAMPSRCNEYGHMPDADAQELYLLLGLPGYSTQGERIPASQDYYQEYVDRAEGREPSIKGVPYWD